MIMILKDAESGVEVSFDTDEQDRVVAVRINTPNTSFHFNPEIEVVLNGVKIYSRDIHFIYPPGDIWLDNARDQRVARTKDDLERLWGSATQCSHVATFKSRSCHSAPAALQALQSAFRDLPYEIKVRCVQHYPTGSSTFAVKFERPAPFEFSPQVQAALTKGSAFLPTLHHDFSDTLLQHWTQANSEGSITLNALPKLF